MRNQMKSLVVSFLFLSQAIGQTAHVATLQWTDSINPPGTLYNVYRVVGTCPPATPSPPINAVFTRIASMLGALTYQDKTITTGTFCFAVSAISNGGESGLSNVVQVTVISAPTGLTVVIQ